MMGAFRNEKDVYKSRLEVYSSVGGLVCRSSNVNRLRMMEMVFTIMALMKVADLKRLFGSIINTFKVKNRTRV